MRASVRTALGIFVVLTCVMMWGEGAFAKQRPPLCIQGTMADEETPIAIVNDKIVAAGEEIEGARVISITDSTVEFEYEGEVVSLLLGEECVGGSWATDRQSGWGYRPKVTRQQQAAASRQKNQKAGEAVALAFTGVAFIISLLLGLASYAFVAFCLQKMAHKVGITENSWWAWVPLLNALLMIQISGKEWWWIVLAFIPFVNIIVIVMIWMGICENMDKSPWLGLLVLVPAANIFLMAYLAFSSDDGAGTPTPPPSKTSEPPGELPEPPPVYNA